MSFCPGRLMVVVVGVGFLAACGEGDVDQRAESDGGDGARDEAEPDDGNASNDASEPNGPNVGDEPDDDDELDDDAPDDASDDEEPPNSTTDGGAPDQALSDALDSGAGGSGNDGTSGPLDGGVGQGGEQGQKDAAVSGTAGGDGGPGPAGPDGGSGCPLQGADGASYLDIARSGSRLEARYWTAEGMPNAFRGFFDTELGVYCRFDIATDGTQRCMPLGRAGTRLHHHADASCEQAVYEVPLPCAADVTMHSTRTGCGEVQVVRLVEATASEPQYFLRSDGTCSETEPRETEQQLFVAGETVSPDEFVEGVIVELPGQCQAGLRVVEAEDGATGPYSLFDARWEIGCNWIGAEGDSNCRASKSPVAVPLDFFADANCTERLPYFASWPYGACNPPELVRSVPDSTDFFTVGAPLSEDVYMNFGGPCGPATDQAFIDVLYPLEQAVAPSDLALFSTSFEGTGQLRAAVVAEGSVRLGVTPTTFLDTTSGQNCDPRLFSDGVRRCIEVPISGGFNDWYNDAECTQPLRDCPEDDCTGLLRYDLGLDATTCSAETVVTGFWRYVEPASAYHWFDGQSCVPIEDPGTGEEWVVEAVDPGTLGVIDESSAEARAATQP